MVLVSADAVDNSKISFQYKMTKNPITYCESLYTLKDFSITSVNAVAYDSNMKPCKTEAIADMNDLQSCIARDAVSKFNYAGIYENVPVSICVDFDLTSVFIITTEEFLSDVIAAKL